MKGRYKELIGLLATKAELISTYHIDYIYRVAVGDDLEDAIIQKGFDFDLHIPFQEIVRHLAEAYAPALKRQWSQKTPLKASVLMSLHPDLRPVHIGGTGVWEVNWQW